ncbi:MAG: pantoate--beta-alanine ligase [Planctomycetota bacterium]|nr:pantoate--beta-alanine ligase [Planctomycetota bacterium]
MQSDNPQLVTTVDELRERLSAVRRADRRIGLVPTMGALHEGHLSLVRASRESCDYTVVTIFVNPAQFGPDEDLDAYPRALEADMQALAQCGADLVFAPANNEVYRPGHQTWVEVDSLSKPLEGSRRPTHFRGVTTVVMKLFNMAGADAVFFGQKDYQQALVIRRMVADLDMPTEIHVCPIVREADGLAMSSRNAYLGPAGREQAVVLWKSLRLAEELVAEGERNAARIVEQMREMIAAADLAEIQYIALSDPQTLQPVEEITGETLAALAVVVENTRLIDNCLLRPGSTAQR